MKIKQRKFIALIAIFSALSLSLLGGCSADLSGELNENQAPIVWFVNVPPSENITSTNPIINWVGQDIDGQIQMYRYIVLTEAEIVALDDVNSPIFPIDTTDAVNFIQSIIKDTSKISESSWTHLNVDLREGDPKTSNIIPMRAEISDPLNTKVRQYIFVQAFDDAGKGSLIIFREFNRIDNPPDTRTRGFTGGPFINADTSGSSITGVRMRWEGSDAADFPTDPPPFEFEWRIYGPYYSFMDDAIPLDQDSTWGRVQREFIREVFVTNDAKVFLRVRNPSVFPTDDSLSFEVCDTIGFEIDSAGNAVVDSLGNAIPIFSCDTVLVDTFQAATPLGFIDTIFHIGDTAFVNNANGLLDRVARRSNDPFDGDEWVSDLSDSIYSLYDLSPAIDSLSDTTKEEFFVFWVRSRDDAKVPDLTPTFETFSVIDPKYENDIGVVDVSFSFEVNGRILDSAKAYWDKAIGDWQTNTGTTVNYTTNNYSLISSAQGSIFPLRRMLSHNVLIIVNDQTIPGNMAEPGFAGDLYTAIDAGVNVWMCGRDHSVGGEAVAPIRDGFSTISTRITGVQSTDPFAPVIVNNTFTGLFFYFGVENTFYSGWELFKLESFAFPPPYLRIEDFIGALTLNENKWPNLKIDTARLHSMYRWKDHYPWRPDIASMPEVNWYIRNVASEAMYLYESKYGQTHFLPDIFFSFNGKPVMHRLDRGSFRTVYSRFTPYAFEQVAMQEVVDSMLSFLVENPVSSPPFELRYPDSRYPTSNAETGDRFWGRRYEEAMKDPELSQKLIQEDLR